MQNKNGNRLLDRIEQSEIAIQNRIISRDETYGLHIDFAPPPPHFLASLVDRLLVMLRTFV